MFEFIDNYLNVTTMYRLVLHYLAVLWIFALILSAFQILPYEPLSLILSIAFITAASWIANTVFAKVFSVPTNIESVYITALILTLIIPPFGATGGSSYLMFLAWASVWSMAGKYIIAIKKKHLFNPAALAVAMTAIFINQPAIWWVGNVYMLPVVILGGLLMTRKLKASGLVWSFIITALLAITGFSLFQGTSFITSVSRAIFQSPLLFFAFVMLTEPLTKPPTKILQMAYGALVGFLFAPGIHLGSIYSTPELALLVGNVFSYAVSPKEKLLLTLRKKTLTGEGLYDFSFIPDQCLSFAPGQYMEWTLGHADPDNRGNRRYFTLASSPTEKNILLGVKFYPESSSFKRALFSMKAGDTIVASQLSGEFTLPQDKEKKLVFLAGGIGVTPFRSMVQYLLDKNEKRDIVIFYSNKVVSEITYKNIFKKAQKKLGIKTIYALTDKDSIPENWNGHIGRVDEKIIKKQVPDYLERTFYVSGPHAMVTAFEKTLSEIGVPKNQIKTDFFPGFV